MKKSILPVRSYTARALDLIFMMVAASALKMAMFYLAQFN